MDGEDFVFVNDVRAATSVSGGAEITVERFSVTSDLPPLEVVEAGDDYQPPSGKLDGRQGASSQSFLAEIELAVKQAGGSFIHSFIRDSHAKLDARAAGLSLGAIRDPHNRPISVGVALLRDAGHFFLKWNSGGSASQLAG